MRSVFVVGTGGLGNCLFQISAAIYYCEKYNCVLKLVKTPSLLLGTSNQFGKNKCHKIDNNIITYDKTIFNKIDFVTNINIPTIKIDNNYTNNKLLTNITDILISGYNQNLELFSDIMLKIPKYLNLDDIIIKKYIFDKYGDINNGTMIGVRIGKDFKHMKKIKVSSYQKAIEYFKNNNIITEKIYIISDMHTSDFFNFDNNFIQINESDIIQFYFGLLCRNYILSESTFHLWIAYLGTNFGVDESKKVICFNNTDITNRNLFLKNWITIHY